MRGRPPKSEEAKALAGNPGKRAPPAERRLLDVPDAPPDAYSAPGMLTERARGVWVREIPRLRSLNLLRPTDLAAFGVYCETVARYEMALAALSDGKLTYSSSSRHGSFVRVRPEVGIVERCERAMRQFMESLGMTSTSRMRALASLASRQLPLPLGDVKAPATAMAPDNKESPVAYLLH